MGGGTIHLKFKNPFYNIFLMLKNLSSHIKVFAQIQILKTLFTPKGQISFNSLPTALTHSCIVICECRWKHNMACGRKVDSNKSTET